MDYVPAHGDATRKDDRDEISGARVFDGEDQGKFIIDNNWSHEFQVISSMETSVLPLFWLLSIGYGTRLRMQQLQQRDWIEQQKREKELLKEQEKFRDTAFDVQTKHFNQLLEEA